MRGAIPPLPNTSSSCGAQLKHRGVSKTTKIPCGYGRPLGREWNPETLEYNLEVLIQFVTSVKY
jgi:hypothetical protein